MNIHKGVIYHIDPYEYTIHKFNDIQLYYTENNLLPILYPNFL